VGTDGKRRSIRLGKMPMKAAEEVCRRVEYLVAAKASGTAIDNDTARWLASTSDAMHAKLAAVGLVEPRIKANVRLGDFIDAYIAGRSDVKRRTRLNLRIFGDRLIAFFGRNRDLRSIKRSDADAWVIHLKAKYADATWGRTIRGAQQFFTAAVRAEIIDRNPFDDLKAGSFTDKDRQRFVTREDIARVLDACPDAEWRLIVALCRYGGLRCPSELLVLTWADVDWERSRFHVDSPKTGPRWVPLFPELRPFLEEVYERAPEGTRHVITRYRDSNVNLRTQLVKYIRRAGLVPWPKPFHNLRASRETELAAVYPLHVVCAWIGNSSLIAAKHYLQVTDADFESAAKCGAVAVQNPVQQAAARARTSSRESTENEGGCGVTPEGAEECETVRNEGGIPGGREPGRLRQRPGRVARTPGAGPHRGIDPGGMGGQHAKCFRILRRNLPDFLLATSPEPGSMSRGEDAGGGP
jgi:integrase